MQQVCSWCAHDHDIHIQEPALTHTGSALGECHNHFVGCICFDVGMVPIFPVFPVPDRVLPGHVCLCGYVFLCMHTRGHVHEAQHACRVLLLFFGVCSCPSGAPCVLPAAWASLQGLGPGSAVALCVAVGLEPGVCSGHREPCPDRAGAAPRDASPDTPPASVCRQREDGEGTARCQAFFLHKQGYLGPIGA